MLVATAGHVDHGKTSLIKALTDVDTDRLAEEKKRGLTIELGFAYKTLGSAGTIGFIDVPGHEKFLSNMLAGVAGIDLAMLVIAADDGPMPQTIEHLAALHLLGITQGLVVISKVDRVSEQRLGEVRTEIEALTKDTFLADMRIFPVSTLTNNGLSLLTDYLNQRALQLTKPDPKQQRFRLAIDRWFIKSGHGVVVTGTVFSGETAVGDQLILSNSGLREKEQTVRVRTIHANGKQANYALAGQRCALNITGRNVDIANISRGDWLLCEQPAAPANQLDARLTVLAREQSALKHGSPVHIHIGASHVQGRVIVLDNLSAQQQAKPQRSIEAGKNGLARLVLDSPIYTCTGDRFIIRDQSSQRTIGGGFIIDNNGPKRGRSWTSRLDSLAIIELTIAGNVNGDPISPESALQQLLEKTPVGLYLESLFVSWNLSAMECSRIKNKLDAVFLISIIFSTRNWRSLSEKIIDFITQWHGQNPENQGIAPDQLWTQLNLSVSWTTLVEVANKLIEQHRLARTGHLLHLPGHAAKVSEQNLSFWQQVRPFLEDGINCPPVLHDLADQLSMNIDELRDSMAQLAHLGWLTKVGPNRYFTAKSLRALADQTQVLVQADQQESVVDSETLSDRQLLTNTFSVAQFRDASGIGRRPCIEILEFFDTCGLTQRIDNSRNLIQKPAIVFPLTENH